MNDKFGITYQYTVELILALFVAAVYSYVVVADFNPVF